jgi:DNA-binding transcriptional regulator of glucitol operon
MVGHLMVVLAVLVCLRLGLWQWHRTHEADGTVQNLGYTILWPIFGGGFVYMWFRFLQLETIKDAEDDDELTAMAAGGAQPPAALSGQPADVTDDSTIAAGSSDPHAQAKADLTAAHVGSETAVGAADGGLSADDGEGTEPPAVVAASPASWRSPSRAYTVAVSTVGDENDDEDPELAAYNRALAALAEKDHRRAR